ncbi:MULTISPECIES: hypothetical protein [Aeromonas]|uniref:hypothetical protein n=1 Tax=Aeromonas TaxID=642 RepID=UPI0029D44C1C|nr:hypothetical protein [Aeromonas caviae]MDX7699938.1 hypothetical protein [Aeromonas caviae]
MSFDIYSDIDYSGYQHVNQMLFNELSGRGLNAKFYHRFYMNMPSIKIFKRWFSYRRAAERKVNNNCVVSLRNDLPNVIKINNFPSLNMAMDLLNSFYVTYQVEGGLSERSAITFTPSMALKYHFEKYRKLIYYCVHDSLQQSYHGRHREYEIELSKKADFVFCDNEIVISRLAADANYTGKIVNISDYDTLSILNEVECGCRFFIVPPPVPDVFYSATVNTNSQFKYDFVYFGSIHENIDDEIIYSLADDELRILMITNQRLKYEHKNIHYTQATADMNHLVTLIASGEFIILPYKNTRFMETVSPAKIYQSIATGKRVFTTNKSISCKYRIDYISVEDQKNVLMPLEFHSDSFFDISKYKASMLLDKIIHIISVD